MRENRVVRMALALTASVAMVAALSLSSSSQTRRPRYASPGSDRTATIPEGTIISLRMDGDLSSRTSHVGDKFTATVTIPVYVDGRPVIPAGAIVEGSVTGVTPAKRMSKSGTISVGFDSLVFPDGSRVRINGNLTSADPAERRRIDSEGTVSGDNGKRSVVFIGGGGAVGAVLGGISGGGTGAVTGGIIGAGAGVAAVMLSKGAEAEVRSGTPFGIQLSQALDVGESITAESGVERARPDGDRDYPPADSNRADPSMPDSSGPRSDSRPRSDNPDSGGPPYYSRRGRSQPDNPNPPDSAPADTPSSQPDNPRPEPEASEPSYPLSSTEMIKRAQGALRDQGYYEGPIDGTMGPRTSTAIRAYQRDHNLTETGDLDPATARSLGILGGSSTGVEVQPPPVAGRRDRDTGSSARRQADRDSAGRPDSASDDVAANVLSATANRTSDGAIHVMIQTQANTGGWRWFGEHRVNGDTLEIDARAIRPTGYSTQMLTRGKIEMNIRDDVQSVRRVVVHGAGGDMEVPLKGSPYVSNDARRAGDGRAGGRDRVGTYDPSGARTGPYDSPAGGGRDRTGTYDPSGGSRTGTYDPSGARTGTYDPSGGSRTGPYDSPAGGGRDRTGTYGPSSGGRGGTYGSAGSGRGRTGAYDSTAARGIQRQADNLLSDYRRMIGVRTTSSGVELGRARYAEPEVALLFAFDGFSSAARLYNQVAPSFGDPEGLRGATLALARAARRTDRLITTSDAQAARAVAAKWDAIRQDVLRLMDSQNITSSEIEDR